MNDPLSPEEAGDLLGVHRTTIVRWINDGTLPAWRIDKKYRVNRENVLAMVQPVGRK